MSQKRKRTRGRAQHGVPLSPLTRAEVLAQIAYLEAQHAIIGAAIAELRAMLPAAA